MSKLVEIAALGRAVWRTYGARGLRRRVVHELRRAVGGYQRRPRCEILRAAPPPPDSIYSPHGSFDSLSPAIKARIRERGQRVIGGSYEAFGHEWRMFPPTTDHWSSSVGGSYRFACGPWWTVPHLPPQADIKDVWEPARFGWIYDLIRAHRLSNDSVLAAALFQRLDEWLASSHPFDGVHWSCGQETAVRAIALLHAEAWLATDRRCTEADRQKIAQVLAWSGERIASAVGYALSQRNNHGISEAAGLVHIGLRLRREHPRAAAWVAAGRRLLDEQIQDQFLDGWYAQHSFYYMRVALDQALLAQRALQRAGESLAAPSIERIEAAVDLIAMLIDGGSGEVPNCGANDGSRVLPLSSAAYRDFRPLLTLAALVLERPLPADVPADPEVLAWVGGELPPPASPRMDGVYHGPKTGWVVVRHQGTVAFLRAGEFCHRPAHLDLLHLDLSVDGRELIVDPGSFAYNAAPPWRNGLAVARVHNAPLLDDSEPASRGPRFLWRQWPSSRLIEASARQDSVRVIAEVPDRVKREVLIRRGEVLVVDTVLDPSVKSIQVTWLVHPDLADVDIVHADGANDVRPLSDEIDAWFSPTYGRRVPTRAIRVVRERTWGKPLQVRTRIVLPSSSVEGRT